MTREQAKKMLPFMQAYAEGKTIEYSYDGEHWERNDAPVWDCDVMFRIKPQPKYRPFKSQEECWNEMLKHHPFGWIKDEYKYVHIVCVHKNKIEFSPDEDNDGNLFTSTMDFTSVYEQGGYTFADGTPFGIREE